MKARILAALLLVAASGPATAQAWPDRPVKFISSQAAGGGTDMIGRLVADQLSAKIGQPVVYENRPGGGNVIGTQAAARSAPNGYAFFYASAAALVTEVGWQGDYDKPVELRRALTALHTELS